MPRAGGGGRELLGGCESCARECERGPRPPCTVCSRHKSTRLRLVKRADLMLKSYHTKIFLNNTAHLNQLHLPLCSLLGRESKRIIRATALVAVGQAPVCWTHFPTLLCLISDAEPPWQVATTSCSPDAETEAGRCEGTCWSAYLTSDLGLSSSGTFHILYPT